MLLPQGQMLIKHQKKHSDDVTIEGVIFGKKDMLESDLTQYVMKLENSPIFRKVSCRKKMLSILKKMK